MQEQTVSRVPLAKEHSDFARGIANILIALKAVDHCMSIIVDLYSLILQYHFSKRATDDLMNPSFVEAHTN